MLTGQSSEVINQTYKPEPRCESEAEQFSDDIQSQNQYLISLVTKNHNRAIIHGKQSKRGNIHQSSEVKSISKYITIITHNQ